MSHTIVKHPPLPASPAQGSQEHFNLRVRYVLDPPSHLPREDMEKVERNVFADAERHPDWLDELSKEQQVALREKMALWKGRK
jgi:hypothetical protein